MHLHMGTRAHPHFYAWPDFHKSANFYWDPWSAPAYHGNILYIMNHNVPLNVVVYYQKQSFDAILYDMQPIRPGGLVALGLNRVLHIHRVPCSPMSMSIVLNRVHPFCNSLFEKRLQKLLK